jgi:mannose-6-phosphate isomerase-like protein (cupin superfamily)
MAPRRTVLALAANLLLAMAMLCVASPAATAATAAAAARPHRGSWHFVNNNGSVKTAHMTVGPGGKIVRKISVRPAKRAGCRSSATATILGRFHLTGRGRGYKWHLGGKVSANAPVVVTIRQHGKRTHGDLFIGFRTRHRALGELELGSAAPCVLFFGLKT